LATIAKHAALANCICGDNVFAYYAAEFDLEMNRPCPVHGFRSLDEIDRIYFVSPDRSVVEEPKIDELI
jgi:hypothetical protein